jgi:hypothetical protein
MGMGRPRVRVRVIRDRVLVSGCMFHLGRRVPGGLQSSRPIRMSAQLPFRVRVGWIDQVYECSSTGHMVNFCIVPIYFPVHTFEPLSALLFSLYRQNLEFI